KTEIIGSRVGFRPFNKNHLPVFGPLPNFEELIIANGLGASGLSTAPFIGKQLAKKISGETTDVPISDYDVRLAEYFSQPTHNQTARGFSLSFLLCICSRIFLHFK